MSEHQCRERPSIEEHEKKWCCFACGRLVVGVWAGSDDAMLCDECKPPTQRQSTETKGE